MTQGNGVDASMPHACTHTDARTYCTRNVHIQLIVTDRAERAAFSRHDESLTGEREGERETWREGDRVKELTGEETD